jgi:hypothetical protein
MKIQVERVFRKTDEMSFSTLEKIKAAENSLQVDRPLVGGGQRNYSQI